MSEWIPVTERLPGHEESVMYYCSMILVGHFNSVDKRWRFDPDEMLETETVTHWMPLPEPPKEGKP